MGGVKTKRACKSGLLARAAGLALLAGGAMAASGAEAKDYKAWLDIPAQTLEAALKEFGVETDSQVLFTKDLVAGRASVTVKGVFTPREALALLTRDAGIHIEQSAESVFLIKSATAASAAAPQKTAQAPASSPPTDAPKDQTNDDDEKEAEDDRKVERVIVTGTSIRGKRPKSSPVDTYTTKDIERTGATTTEQFIQKLPQNFGTRTANATGANTGGGANNNYDAVNSVDLRGLGQGTTLTLVNGRRFGSSDFGRSVDISLIPLGAIERVEVLTDGASAIYGSDAIGGVVNIILRRDFEGAETRATYGGVTDGHLRQGSLSQMFGHAWGSGYGLVAYNGYSASPLEYGERSYTAPSGPGTLLPNDTRHNLLATFSQDLGERLTVGGDFMFSRRNTKLEQTSRFSGFPLFDSFFRHKNETDQAFANIDFDYAVTDQLNASVQASYSNVDTQSHSVTSLPNFTPPSTTPFDTDTHHTALDITATLDGVAFRAPGGDVRFSLGVGVLDEGFNGSRSAAQLPSNRDLGRTTTYAFAEILAPLVSEEQDVPFVHLLELSLAGRYTSYEDTSSPLLGQDFGDATDPKVGLYWAPFEWLGLRGTYGTSFRAPSLTQLDPSGGQAQLNRRTIAGVPLTYRLQLSPYAADGLQPETAETFTLGFVISPVPRPTFRLSGTYYSIDYTDRIAGAPTGPDLFTNPQNYPDAMYHPPSAAFIEEALGTASFTIAASAPGALAGVNLSDRHALAAALFALPNLFIQDSRLKNLALSKQDGFDLSIIDRFDTGWGSIDVGTSITAILSYRQQGSSTAPIVTQVDRRGLPVDLRGRAFASFSRGGFTGTLNLNYMDDYQNGDPIGVIDSWTTADLSLSYDFADASGGLSDGLRLNLSVQNLFDSDPPFVGLPIGAPQIGFDAVNANAVGRLVTVGLTKRW